MKVLEQAAKDLEECEALLMDVVIHLAPWQESEPYWPRCQAKCQETKWQCRNLVASYSKMYCVTHHRMWNDDLRHAAALLPDPPMLNA
jgi:hypothetical protein